MKDSIKRENQKRLALELEIKGYTLREIADKLQCSIANASIIKKEALEDLQERNTNELIDIRNIQLIAIKKLIKSRFEDLNSCDDIIAEDGKLYRNGVRERGFVIKDLLSLYQEIGKIFGIYAPERIEQLISSQKDNEMSLLQTDVSNMSGDELKAFFADVIRETKEDK